LRHPWVEKVSLLQSNKVLELFFSPVLKNL
jgi:hypothetical protein